MARDVLAGALALAADDRVMKRRSKAGWIIFRLITGIIQLLGVIYVLAAITDANTRLIVAVLGLLYLTAAGGLALQTQLLLQFDIENELRFHELMQMADPDRQRPDRQDALTIIETNWISQTFFGLVSLICLLTVFGSLH